MRYTYNKELVTCLARLYHFNPSHPFSSALEITLGGLQPATVKDACFCVRVLEDIARVAKGESRFLWSEWPRDPRYITYIIESWIREGLELPHDIELLRPVLFKPDFILQLPLEP